MNPPLLVYYVDETQHSRDVSNVKHLCASANRLSKDIEHSVALDLNSCTDVMYHLTSLYRSITTLMASYSEYQAYLSNANSH